MWTAEFFFDCFDRKFTSSSWRLS